jgi:hypothetical protein
MGTDIQRDILGLKGQCVNETKLDDRHMGTDHGLLMPEQILTDFGRSP